jgi:outer membrane receptor protein involved in Fe transport
MQPAIRQRLMCAVGRQSRREIMMPGKSLLALIADVERLIALGLRSVGGRSKTPRLLVALGLFLALGVPISAQNGSVSGTISDESGGVLPGATVTLTGPGVRHTVTSGPAGEYRLVNLAAGSYQITATLSGFTPATRDNIVVSGGEVAVPPIVLALAGIGEAVVVSASKVESTVINAPATMTVVPGSMLQVLPAQNYGDVLRSVPGMNVIQVSARDINLTSRQATRSLATSQLTLLDGRSIYLDFLGVVLWDFLPTNPSDIKQIEVVRGPASAVWGANALTGVVNIITKSPRETPGATTVIFNGGMFDRDAGSTAGKSAGTLWGTSVSTSQVLNDRWSYRLSAGYFDSDPYPRPVGVIPVVTDPRDPTGRSTVGGQAYPADSAGAFGSAFQNSGTSQPKFDARVDQELSNGRVTYAGGIAGTSGTIYSGIGPFEIQPGSTMSYGRMNYSRGALKFSLFENIVEADAPNLLLPDPRTLTPLQLSFKTKSFDVEIGHSRVVAGHHALSYGGNFRRNTFDITLAPNAKDRNEIGMYAQDEIFVDKFRLSIGARVDKFGNLEDPVFSPRLAAVYQPTADHAVRVSFNRAFRSPSTVNNFLDISLVNPVDLRGLAPLLPPPLQPLVATPFPLVVGAIGSELPVGSTPQAKLKQESLTAYEVAYTGTIQDKTTVGVAFYINELDDAIHFVTLPNQADPYSAANPPPGWVARGLPPELLTAMAQAGVFLPRTAFIHLNLPATRQRGVELSLDERFSKALSAFVNYSWQGNERILDGSNQFPVAELSLAPAHRFNVGATYNGPRYLGSVIVNYTDKALWSDVLTTPYHGFTDAFTLVNGSFGIKWNSGTITTSIRGNNILNRTVQQHVFGDLIRRSVTAELRLDF